MTHGAYGGYCVLMALALSSSVDVFVLRTENKKYTPGPGHETCALSQFEM